MRGSIRGFFQTLLLLSASWICAANANPKTGSGLPAYAPDHVLVKLKGSVRAELNAVTPADRLMSLAGRLGLPAAVRLREPRVSQLLREQGAEPQSTMPNLDRFLYLDLPPGLSVQECVSRLSSHPLVEFVEPDGVGRCGAVVPDDPDFSQQWHHTNSSKPTACISTPLAWSITTGSSNVLVAVLDTGLNSSLAEFAGRVVTGYNFVVNSTDTADDEGHGTAVTGTLAANANNGILGAGVDWHCRLLPVKVINSTNFGYYSWWAQGVDFAVSQGCKVINLSAGGSGSSQALTQSILTAIARGVIFVTISGNDGTNTLWYPGNLSNCITAGATDQNDQLCDFSDYGPEIGLVAPGIDIQTVGQSGSLEAWYGTSFAAPQVAGVCALLAAIRPSLTQAGAKALLYGGADDQVGGALDTPGFDNYFGWGRLNAYNSLLLARIPIDSFSVNTNQAVVLSWPSPPNASNKQPFQVQFTTTLGRPWTTSSGQFQYLPTRTFWTNYLPQSATNAQPGFYRVGLRQF